VSRPEGSVVVVLEAIYRTKAEESLLGTFWAETIRR
jgi:hypothetical protein